MKCWPRYISREGEKQRNPQRKVGGRRGAIAPAFEEQVVFHDSDITDMPSENLERRVSQGKLRLRARNFNFMFYIYIYIYT